MIRMGVGLRIFIVLLLLGVTAELAFAIMPPEVYQKAIESSPIKAVAVVRKVTVTEETKYYIEKKVEFELIKSYGVLKPSKVFYGYCKSATDNPIVGGTIYYYPQVGEKVFVTLDGVSNGDDSGYITSFTEVDGKLQKTLDNLGIRGLRYGMGKVGPKL